MSDFLFSKTISTGDLGAGHAPFPNQLAVQVNFRPYGVAHGEMRRVDHRQGDVALAGRRPDGGGDGADLCLAGMVGIDQRVVGRLVALDIQPDQAPSGAALFFRQQSTAAVEMALVEIDQPTQTQFQRRSIASAVVRGI